MTKQQFNQYKQLDDLEMLEISGGSSRSYKAGVTFGRAANIAFNTVLFFGL